MPALEDLVEIGRSEVTVHALRESVTMATTGHRAIVTIDGVYNCDLTNRGTLASGSMMLYCQFTQRGRRYQAQRFVLSPASKTDHIVTAVDEGAQKPKRLPFG